MKKTTRAEQIRTMLSEVAPELAALVGEPSGRYEWSVLSLPYGRTREEYGLVWRARELLHAGEAWSMRYCFECGWRAHDTRDKGLRARLVSEGCEHVERVDA